ncbi:hypothetical protein CfE428DRAFT_2311 [Chthoniobacter flavus Ellin428]|uniref:Sulfatase-modifying factor enzyme-like domain-containing protein n=1 Tax=Chthoniobacter flavus Ellin428 TaxID=497964 RepID=B4D073_9BACT|nr:SUMF1/EgtB/PvdO family nonheme iron enzyme [Chthoniobacter flavus]EDY20387.1 hypothetical protein CfE428DRAFT_2311 [Chthoniobacter flavus Ellin428]TCO94277.1 putative secreted protein with PEP-CTERM sorting signal [Chthoniobacter flavus]
MLPSAFDDTFETIATHDHPFSKTPEVKKGTSSLHVAIAGVVPKYDGKTDSKWWGSGGEAGPAESRESFGKTSGATRGPSLLGMLRQQLGDSGSSAAGDFDAPFRDPGTREGQPRFESILNLLALNPLGDVQTMAAALPPSAIFRSSTMPLRENAVPIDDGSSSSANVPSPHSWNSYAAVPISVSNGSLALNSAPAAAVSPVTTTPLTSPPLPATNIFTPAPFRASSVSIPASVPVSSPIVPSVASSAPASSISQGLRVFVKIPSAAPTTTSTPTFTTSAISSPASGTTTTLANPVLTASNTTATTDIGYQFVPVGNAGNANDLATGNKFGAVSYNYDIGKYDVTLTQYTAFLNAVAATDAYGLYNASMASDGHIAGISQTGVNGTYHYTVVGDGQRPVTYVSWFDAARFANWVNNGQPVGLGEVSGSTEDGAYTLHGANAGVATKNANAQVWIPSESEWYKAAYYDPTLNGGAGGYWSDAAQSNTSPGNTVGSQPNQANYLFAGGDPVHNQSGNFLTDVGAFSMSISPYGTFDQMGDVNEWNDGIVGPGRGIRGGAWDSLSASDLLSTNFSYNDPTTENADTGFRLAMIPEPAAWPSLLGGIGLLVAWRRRRNAA